MATKEEISQLIKNKSDEIKLEFLEKMVKDIKVDQETRKIAFLLMSEIYEKKMWWANAAKSYMNAADLAKTFDDKKDLFFKAGIFFIKAQDYFTADDTFRKSIVLAAKKDKETLQKKVIQVYMSQAQEYESKRQQVKAISAYNKMLSLKLPIEEANKIRDKIAELYDKVGKPREANFVRAQKASASEAEKKKVFEPEKEQEEEFIGI
jgi:tetratricopeptide (TPR) repeat protein